MPEPAFKAAIAQASREAAAAAGRASNGSNGAPAGDEAVPAGTQPDYGAPAGWHAPGWPPPANQPQQAGYWYPPQQWPQQGYPPAQPYQPYQPYPAAPPPPPAPPGEGDGQQRGAEKNRSEPPSGD
jgi:cell division protease FtsH